MSARFISVMILLAAPAWAECPAPPDHGKALGDLIEQAQTAPNEATGRSLSNRTWKLWTDAPDAHAQNLLESGMSRREIYDFNAAIRAFDALVDYCPGYAEGYNQRGFIHYLREEFDKALPDLQAALELQ